MSIVSNDGVSLYYHREGESEDAGEPVVFVSEAGLGGWSWGWQHAALTGPHETVVWDLRGTGRSDAPPGPYELATLVEDLEAVLAAVDARNAHLVGAGFGGAVALAAARESTRVATLSVLGTAARGSAFDLEPLLASPDDRATLRNSLEAGLSADFRESQPEVLEGITDWRADGDATSEGWEAQLAALEGFDARDWLVEVTQPAHVLHGTDDALVSPDAGRELAAGLPRGEFVPIEDASHLVGIERSRTVNDRLLGFLEDRSDTDR